MPFSAEASAALIKQIEEMAPSAAVLESVGVDWETAGTLARFIKSGAPDINALREHGIPLERAIGICESITKRHARVSAALARVPEPLPSPPAPAGPEQIDQFSARSLLHDLCLQISAERGDATELNRAGFSWATSKELAHLIDCTRRT